MNQFNLWDSPEGEMIKLESKKDLVNLINKLGFTSTSKLESFGIFFKKRQMTQDELDTYGYVFDEMYPEQTLTSDVKYLDLSNTIPTVLPIFHKNPHLTKEKQLSYGVRNLGILHITEDDIELSKNYQFPCILYVCLTKGFDRVSNYEVKIWKVLGIDNIPTVSTFQKEEDEYAEIWNQNLEDAIRMQKEQEG